MLLLYLTLAPLWVCGNISSPANETLTMKIQWSMVSMVFVFLQVSVSSFPPRLFCLLSRKGVFPPKYFKSEQL